MATPAMCVTSAAPTRIFSRDRRDLSSRRARDERLTQSTQKEGKGRKNPDQRAHDLSGKRPAPYQPGAQRRLSHKSHRRAEGLAPSLFAGRGRSLVRRPDVSGFQPSDLVALSPGASPQAGMCPRLRRFANGRTRIPRSRRPRCGIVAITRSDSHREPAAARYRHHARKREPDARSQPTFAFDAPIGIGRTHRPSMHPFRSAALECSVAPARGVLRRAPAHFAPAAAFRDSRDSTLRFTSRAGRPSLPASRTERGTGRAEPADAGV